MPRTLLFLVYFISLPLVLNGQGDVLLDDDEWLDALLDGDADDLGLDADRAASRDLDTEDRFLIGGMRLWEMDASLAGGVGWKENVLLSEEGGVDSFYSSVEGDLFGFGTEGNGWPELVALLYGEYKYCDDVPGIDAETLALLQTSATSSLSERWKVAARFDGIYTEQAFDASVNDFETDAALMRTWRPELGVSLMRESSRGDELRIDLLRGYSRYGQESEDYDDYTGSVAYLAEVGRNGEMHVSLTGYREDYEERLERLSVGSLVDAPLLEVTGLFGMGEWRYAFSDGFLKRTVTRASFESEDDALGDYYERERWQLRQSVDLAYLGWDVRLSVSYEEVDYAERLVSILSEETRSDEAWRWDVEGVRRLKSGLEFFFRYQGADKQSNGTGFSYQTSGAMFGFRINSAGDA
ncbi:hypothetical protein [Pelagicoccus mobilis]|uniref:Beta-barrel porin 2 n=1 Tax=Pelagicoccus mobilis TaxID=415221 RepID=A0A934RWQ7_9BACT|nr:hypothetical protein [Pelagicoccus mobilis]MBK1877916.1 hypothetical protein [Pelagicoccus mobilis]